MKMLIITGCSVVALFLILLLIILFLKLKISVIVNNKIIKLYLYRIKIYDSTTKAKHVKNNKDDFEIKYKNLKFVINFIRKILDDKNDDLVYILKYAKKSLSVKKLDVSLDYGFGDAALTGITGGIIWGLISNICGFVGKYININEFINVAVKPHYTEKIIDFKADFVFNIRLLYLIKTAKHFKRFKNTLKGGN